MHRHVSLSPLQQTPTRDVPLTRATSASASKIFAHFSTPSRPRSNVNEQLFQTRALRVSRVSAGLTDASGWRGGSPTSARRQLGRVRASRGGRESSRDGWQTRNEPYQEIRFGSRQARPGSRFGSRDSDVWHEDARGPQRERDHIEGGGEQGRGEQRGGEGQWQDRNRDGRGREERDGRVRDMQQRASFTRDGGSRYSHRGRSSDEVPRGDRDYNGGSPSGFRNRRGLGGRRDDAWRGEGTGFREGFKQGFRGAEQWESEGDREYYFQGFRQEEQQGEDGGEPELRGRKELFSGRPLAEAKSRDRGGVRGGLRDGGEEGAWQEPPVHVLEVASVGNAFVKRAVRLRQSAASRRASGRVLVAGEVPIREICEHWLQGQQQQGEVQPQQQNQTVDQLSSVAAAAVGAGAAAAEALAAVESTPPVNAVNAPADCPLDILLLQSDSPSPPPPLLARLARRVLNVSPAVMSRLAGVQSVDAAAVAAVMRLPASFRVLDGGDGDEGGRGGASGWGGDLSRVLVLDGVQDPGNLGTLLRTALAFDWRGVFLLPGCCDPFNDKALRASRGVLFRLPVAVGDWSHLLSLASHHNLSLLAAHPAAAAPLPPPAAPAAAAAVDPTDPAATLAAAPDATTSPGASAPPSTPTSPSPPPRGLCLVLGSEGQGLSATALRLCQPVAIPMPGGAESLNVAVAGGILLFLLGPHSPLPPHTATVTS
ncbi:hypothetical protein CLOM_g20096 [Closterium sp. NIES-68]|nr:hypothetical protein CLOM_g20096 [Closterium sp. NIES-68]GJP85056.1 hypothetical protein CLOP_g15160 [Closterium sp. NIES-67]